MQGLRVALAAVFAVCILSFTAPALSGSPDPGVSPQFPPRVTDIEGRTLSVDSLATERNLVVVTLKAPWCPVCQEQLMRLKARLPELEACGVSFVVLAPGSPEELAAIRARTGFDFPFVVDEGLEIARSLGLAMTEDQILPAMLQILPNRRIGWRQLGRNGAYFGDGQLREYFDCTRAV